MDRPPSRLLLILRSLRPGGSDIQDPDVREALGHLRDDDALASWFAREQAFDRAFSEKIRGVRPPAHLLDSILSSAAATASTSPVHPSIFTAPSRRRSEPRRRIVLHRPVATFFAALAAAASIALAVFLAWPSSRARPEFEVLVAEAVRLDDQPLSTEHAGEPLERIVAWLGQKKAPIPRGLPAALAPLETTGADAVQLERAVASAVDFHAPGFSAGRDGTDADRRLRLYVVMQRSCAAAEVPREPRVIEQGDRAVALWRDSEAYYILVVDAPAADLRRFLALPMTARMALVRRLGSVTSIDPT